MIWQDSFLEPSEIFSDGDRDDAWFHEAFEDMLNKEVEEE